MFTELTTYSLRFIILYAVLQLVPDKVGVQVKKCYRNAWGKGNSSDPWVYYETFHEPFNNGLCKKLDKKSKLPHFFNYIFELSCYVHFLYILKKSFTITEITERIFLVLISDPYTLFTYIHGLTYDTHSEKHFF